MKKVTIVLPDDPFKHPEVEFSGNWRGADLRVAERALLRGYRAYITKGGEAGAGTTSTGAAGTTGGAAGSTSPAGRQDSRTGNSATSKAK